MWRILIGFSLIFITSCKPGLTATSPVVPKTVMIAYSPSLMSHVAGLRDCEIATPGLVINYLQTPTNAMDISGSSLLLISGNPPETGISYPISDIQIVVIVNPTNPVDALTTQALQDIYTGSGTNWSEFGGYEQDIHVWTTVEDDGGRIAFDKAILMDATITSNALIAPDPGAMLNAITEDSQSIGYVPQDWITAMGDIEQVKIARVDEKLAEQLRQPVFIHSSDVLDGITKQFMVCVQYSK